MTKEVSTEVKEAAQKITARQREIVDHIIRTGETPYAAATTLNTAPSNIYRILRMTNVKKYLRELTLDHIGLLAPIAARTQAELLNAESESVRAQVSDSILNRHLGKAVERKQIAFEGRIDVTIDLG
jgi:hypothetical protein